MIQSYIRSLQFHYCHCNKIIIVHYTICGLDVVVDLCLKMDDKSVLIALWWCITVHVLNPSSLTM